MSGEGEASTDASRSVTVQVAPVESQQTPFCLTGNNIRDRTEVFASSIIRNRKRRSTRRNVTNNLLVMLNCLNRCRCWSPLKGGHHRTPLTITGFHRERGSR